MKSNRLFYLPALFILMVGISSCSLTFEKRHYRSGYHVEVVKNNPHRIIVDNHLFSQTAEISPTPHKKEDNLEDSKNPQSKENNTVNKPQIVKRKLPVIDKKSVVKIPGKKIKRGSDCDVITLKDGAQIDALIINIGEDVISYKKCNFESGPLYTISTSTVDIIHLRNGDYYKPKYTINTNNNNNTNNTKGNSNGIGEMIVSIMAFVFSLFAFVLCFLGFAYGITILAGVFGTFGFIMGIFGTVFSAIRMHQGNRNHTLIGVILGSVAILLFMIALTILILA